MEIVTSNIINQLPPNYCELVKLRVGFKDIRGLSDLEIKQECLKIITRSFTYSSPNGQTSTDILTHQTNELFNALKGRYATLTIPEVQKAFKMGLDNEFGAYFGMCGKSYNQFLKGFMDLTDRGKAFNAYLELVDKPPIQEIPQRIKIERSKPGIINYFNEYKKTGFLGLFPYVYYDLLKEAMGVKSLITLEQFKAIKEQTEKTYMAKLVREKQKAEGKGEFNMANAIADALAGGMEKDKTLINLQKGMALKMYFDSVDSLNFPS